MKILVGVMHCIERELSGCLAAIDRQTLPAHDRFVLSGLPNLEAHQTLYRTFMERAQEVDLFIKVDADMVLIRDTFFAELAERFSAEPELEHLQIALDDWMTDRRIYGLHVYRSSHRWRESDDAVFVDMVDMPHHRVNDANRLAPAAVHCPDPSPFQAWHFGLHKGVKFVQKGRSEVDTASRVIHWYHFEGVEAHYRAHPDRRLALALLGFHEAVRNRWGAEEVDFHSAVSQQAFDRWQEKDDAALAKAVRSHFPLGTTWLPISWRFELCRVRLEPHSIGRLPRRLIAHSYLHELPPQPKRSSTLADSKGSTLPA